VNLALRWYLIFLAVLPGGLPAFAEDPAALSAPPYLDGPASRDGIGRRYQGREIARVMGFQGSEWLNRVDRAREERPDLLVEALQLRPDMIIADVGAGSGYLTRRMATLVPRGRVYAVDIQPEMVKMLEALAGEPGLGHVVPVLATADNPQLPKASIDLAVLVDVYHELQYPVEVIRHLVAALKPGGRLVLVEYRGEDPAVAIKPLHKMTEAQVRRELAGFPLAWERTDERLPAQHVITFRKPDRQGA
jgi:SAM-dependent methyltransferase